jgi:TP901 family phage tail tape measure protein
MTAQLRGVKSELAALGASATQAGGAARGSTPSWLSMASAVTAGQLAANLATQAFQALVSPVMQAGKAGTDFGQSMANIRAMVPTAEFDKYGSSIEALALRLGKDYPLSAGEAGKAIETLIQKGTPLEKVVGGAAEQVVKLAAATGGDLNTSAEVVNAALDTFGINIDDIGTVTKTMTGAILSGGMTITDFKYGMNSAGAVVKLMGGSVQDLGVGLTAMAKAGIEGSDAGTSIKSMYMGLTPSTKTATAAMRELGIITADGTNKFIDAHGKVKSYDEIAKVLYESTKDLGEAQKEMALTTIFGTDGIRAAAIAARVAKGDFGDLSQAVESFDPNEVAAKRMESLSGSLKQFGGSSETIGIILFSKLAPALKTVVDVGTTMLNDFLDQLMGGGYDTAFATISAAAETTGHKMYAAGQAAAEMGELFQQEVGGVLGDVGQQIGSTLGSALVGLAALLRGDVRGAADAFGAAIRTGIIEPVSGIAGVVASVTGPLSRLGELAGQVVQKLADNGGVKSFALLLVDVQVAAASSAQDLGKVSSAVGGLVTAVSGGNSGVSGFSAILKGVASAADLVVINFGFLVSSLSTVATLAANSATVFIALNKAVLAAATGNKELADSAARDIVGAMTQSKQAVEDWATKSSAAAKAGMGTIGEVMKTGSLEAAAEHERGLQRAVAATGDQMAFAEANMVLGMEAVVGAVEAAQPDLEAAGVAAASSVTDAHLAEVGAMGEAGAGMSAAASTAVASGAGEMAAAGAEAAAAVTEATTAEAAAMGVAGAEMATAAATAVSSAAPEMTSAAQAVATAATEAVTAEGPAITAAGEAMGAAAAAGVESQSGLMAAAGTAGAGAAVSAVEGQTGAAEGAGRSVGTSLGQGMESGIMAQVGRVAAAAVNMVRSALAAAQGPEGADSHSPSRKAKKQGKDITDGYDAAFNSWSPALQDKIKGALDAIAGYIPVAGEIRRVENEIKDIREDSAVQALFRAQEMITINSEVIRLKQLEVIEEGKLIPIRRELAAVGREISTIERGTLEQRQANIELSGKLAEKNIEINKLEKDKIPLQQRNLELEKEILNSDPDSKKVKRLREEQGEIRTKLGLIDNTIAQIRIQTKAEELDMANNQLLQTVATTTARVRKEGLEDQVIAQDDVIRAIKEEIEVLAHEQKEFAANEAVIKNATENEVKYRERLIAVFRAEGKPLRERIEAGLELIQQLKDEGKISDELAKTLTEKLKKALDGASGSTKGLGGSASTATPQLDAAAKKAKEMADQAARVEKEAGDAAKEVDHLGKELGELPTWFTPGPIHGPEDPGEEGEEGERNSFWAGFRRTSGESASRFAGTNALYDQPPTNLQQLVALTKEYAAHQAEVQRITASLSRESAEFAIARAQESERMIPVELQLLSVKWQQATAERDILPYRQQLAGLTRDIANIERGSLLDRLGIIDNDHKRKEIRLQMIQLERQALHLDRNSAQYEETQKKLRALQDQDRLIALATEETQVKNQLEATGAKKRAEALEDVVKKHEDVNAILKDKADLLQAELTIHEAGMALHAKSFEQHQAARRILLMQMELETEAYRTQVNKGKELLDQLLLRKEITEEIYKQYLAILEAAERGKDIPLQDLSSGNLAGSPSLAGFMTIASAGGEQEPTGDTTIINHNWYGVAPEGVVSLMQGENTKQNYLRMRRRGN